MKKTYSKPVISFESFQLSESIANTCTEKISADTNTCGIKYGFNDTLFTTGTASICTLEEQAKDCYHVPENNPSIFGS